MTCETCEVLLDRSSLETGLDRGQVSLPREACQVSGQFSILLDVHAGMHHHKSKPVVVDIWVHPSTESLPAFCIPCFISIMHWRAGICGICKTPCGGEPCKPHTHGIRSKQASCMQWYLANTDLIVCLLVVWVEYCHYYIHRLCHLNLSHAIVIAFFWGPADRALQQQYIRSKHQNTHPACCHVTTHSLHIPWCKRQTITC